MSMLSIQVSKLRECANNMRRIVANNHHLEKREADWLFSADTELRDAADTIESLRDRLQNLAFERGMNDALEALRRGECEDTRWYELFGTPERAARTVACIGACQRDGDCHDCLMRGCPSCPVFEEGEGEYPFLDWLRGKAVKR